MLGPARCGRSPVTAWLVSAAVLVVPPAFAQFDCLEFSPPLLFDTSGDPSASPFNPRSRGAEVFSWGGHQYLLHGTGNELQLFQADDPPVPGPARDSSFQVPPYGDRDYNLFNFSVCDDCRFGAAGFDVQGMVLWDFGAGTSPAFSGSRRYVDSGTIGAFTFSWNGQQYLIARVSPQCQGNALVTFDGINPEDLALVQCVTDAAGVPIPVDAGFWLDDPVPGDDVVGFVYLLDSSDRDVNMYSVRIVGGHPRLTAEGAVVKAVWILDHGFDVVADPPEPWAPFAVSAYTTGLKVWDLSDPTAPYPIFSGTLPFLVAANSVELRYPFLYVGTMHTVDTGSGHFYDISNPFEPREVDPEFWHRSQPWNDFDYMSNKGGAFTLDAEWLFLARYSVLERFHVDCFELVPPVASFGVSPSRPFPGDPVTVTTTTPENRYTESAMWVTTSTHAILAGSPVMSASTPAQLEVEVPVDLAGFPYTVHVAVARPPAFPCDDPLNHPELCDPVQVASGVLDVDRTPEAVLAVSPPAAITGDVLTLDGRGTEGHPSACWWVVLLDGSEPPVPPPSSCNPSNPVAQYQVPADAPGSWTFRFTAQYPHPGPLGAPWSDADSLQREISSVAAAFTVYPDLPMSTEDVVLCSDSRAATANLGYSWELAEEPSFSSLVTSSDSCAPGIPECGSRCGWVVDEAYFPDQTRVYHARLTLTNQDHPADVSQFTASFLVRDSGLYPGIMWTPTQPAVGDTVVFFVTGVPAVDGTRWDFGLPGCPGYTQVTTCTPSAFTNCLQQAFRYGQTGVGVPVQLWVTVAGVEYGPYTELVDVSFGSCGGCAFELAPVSALFGSAGGPGTISVHASASNCEWTAAAGVPWIHVTSGASGTGDGTVTYSVDPFSGSVRAGTLTVAGETFVVEQTGSGSTTVDFWVSDFTPELGQRVVLTASDDCVTPLAWHLGAPDCDGNDPLLTCPDPSRCRSLWWDYADPGPVIVELECVEGGASRALSVGSSGWCVPGRLFADDLETGTTALWSMTAP